MSVKIRLRRFGSKKNPFYRIVVSDSRSARNGKFIEELGYYNPLTEPKLFKIDNEKALDWISKGAKPTDVVNKLFKTNGVYDGTYSATEVDVKDEVIENSTCEITEQCDISEEPVEEESNEENWCD